MHVVVYAHGLKIHEYHMCSTLVSAQCLKNEL